MYDVIIAGARCAGSALALMLARSGHKVLMLDRAAFPSDTMSGHYIHPAGISWLNRWGVLEALKATDTPRQDIVTLDFGRVALTGTPAPAADGMTSGYGPRRKLFDALLIDAAIAAGAEFRPGVTVKGLISADGRVKGVRAQTNSGRVFEEKALMVIGADGKRSPVASAVGAAAYHERSAATCAYYSYWSGFNASHLHLFAPDGLFIVVMPTNDGLTLIAVTWPIAKFDQVRANLEAAFHDAAASVPWIADRMASARRAERFLGTADQQGFFRTAQGPGWALVGDAGYHRDPITAQGMTDAFLHAELLAEAIDDGLSGSVPMDLAMLHYQKKRDELAMPLYDLTSDLARLAPPPPEMSALLAALSENARETSRFLGVMAGTTKVQDFFAPENLAAIMGARRAA